LGLWSMACNSSSVELAENRCATPPPKGRQPSCLIIKESFTAFFGQ